MCFICSNYNGGILIVNGYGNIVTKSSSTDCIETYVISTEKDFNDRLDYFSYKRSYLYKGVFMEDI